MRPSALDDLRPLDPDDPDFPVALEAMRDALADPLHYGGSDRFWYVDPEAGEPVDMVSVVDLTALGNMAIGSPDWATESKRVRVHPFSDRHAVDDVLDTLVRAVRARRMEAGIPTP